METYVCKYCKYTTTYKGHYARHQKTKKHLKNTSKIKINETQLDTDNDTSKQFKFKSSNEYRLQSRQLYDRFLDNLDKLENPIKNIRDPRYTTETKGDFKIISKSNFNLENDSKIKNKKFQCHYCDDIFQDVWSLIQHFSTCDKQNDFPCEHKDDDFSDSDSDSEKSIKTKDSDWERRNKNPLDDYPDDQKPPFYKKNGDRDTKKEHDFFRKLIKKSEELLNKIEGINNDKN
jgi:hypothetical protein